MYLFEKLASHIRVSKKGQKFQTLKILTKRGKFLFFGLKAFQKCRNHKKILLFRYRYLMSKFLEKLLSKITIFSSKMKWNFKCQFFKFFNLKLISFCQNPSSTQKMCSFEVHHDGEAQKSRKLEGAQKLQLQLFCSPPVFSFFELQ